MNNERSPVIIFTYNRLSQTKLTIEALKLNLLAKEVDLYIYSDFPKSNDDRLSVQKVRKYLCSVTGFKSETIIERKKNFGLAKNIIEGVSDVLDKYKSAIVLEDDLITSKNFLCYMNQALEFYKDKKQVFSISGYSPILSSLNNYDKDTYFSLRPSSWGWATWKHQWDDIDWDITDYNEFITNSNKVTKFNRGGIDMTRMLRHYVEGKNNSWAIRWAYSMFKQGKYSVYPKISKIQNIGFGDDATHCSGINIYHTKLDHSKKCNFYFTKDFNLNDKIIREFRYQYSYINKGIKKVIGYLSKLVLR